MEFPHTQVRERSLVIATDTSVSWGAVAEGVERGQTSVLPRASNVERRASSVKRRTSNVEHRSSSACAECSDIPSTWMPTQKIDHNPAAAHVWVREKGSEWRAQHEFLQVQLDAKAKVDIHGKYIVNMAKQCAQGIKNMYGCEFDFAVLQFAIKDALLIFDDATPSYQKPKVTPERKTGT